MVLAIDLDDTIHDTQNVLPGYKMGRPIKGTVEALEELSKEHKIIIHTVRAVTPEGTKAAKDWLDYFKIPYHQITAIKPNADCYLDNKGMKFTSWDESLTLLKQLPHTY